MLFQSRQFRQALLLLVDLASVLFAYMLAGLLRFSDRGDWFSSYLYTTTLLIYELIMLIVFMIRTPRQQPLLETGRFQNAVISLTNTILVAALGVGWLFATQTAGLISRYFVGFFYVFEAVLNILMRLLYREMLLRLLGKGAGTIVVMLVTVKADAKNIIRNITGMPSGLIDLSCITILDEDCVGEKIEGIPVVGNRENYLETHRENVYDEVFIRLPYDYEFELKKLIMGFEQMGVTVDLSIGVYNLDASERRIRNFGGYSVIAYSPVQRSVPELFIKRLTDIAGSIVGLIFCLISVIIFGPVIKLTSPGPVFFAQTRVGINGRRFQIYKLRTMVADAEAKKSELMAQNEMNGLMFKMENDPRVTKIGRFLRRTSIDELPQFWNVLKGDMSLVGTRPPTVDEYVQYKAYQMRRLSIRPGITGLWQVSGRSEISDFEDVVRLDLEYIDRWSLLLDLKLILQTVWIVFTGRGAK